MVSFSLPDPDVLSKWVRLLRHSSNWAWDTVSRREARSSRKLLERLDQLVDGIWPYLSAGSARADSLCSVLSEVARTSGENQKIQTEILRRYTVVGEWLTFLNAHMKHQLKKPTRAGLLDSVVEIRALIGQVERVIDDFALSASIASAPPDLRQNYARFRDTYNRFLTDYEAFCRDTRKMVREIQEPVFKRLD